ncbi:hypothetical protein FS837_000084 [Tulasnella sp. UAMH 9824]|nr:hypothetical protein FS837_000084 [Tulasnella sp. UAMH 9824]
MSDDHEEFQLIDPSSSFDDQSPHLLPTTSSGSMPPIAYPPPKIESADDAPFNLLPGDDEVSSQPATAPNRNFRSKKRNRVMQSCVACHSQKRKCDRKRPCTRCTEHGIAGQCVYQLEDPAVREGPEQDELLRLRGRVRELEHTVRVLMQKPLSRRAAAALEAETDAILGTTSTRKRKVEKDKLDGSDDKNKKLKCHTHSGSVDLPEWLPMPSDPSFPSPVAESPFSPFAPTPSETHFPHSYYHHFNDFTPPGDVPTPPYSTFPTPSSDAGSPFKIPEPPRRFSDGASLANMLSQATMAATPESLMASSPASASVAGGVTFAPIQGAAPPGECGCGVNPIGNEVLSELAAQLEAAHGVIASLPDHQVGGACVTVLGIASLIDAIATATRSNNTQAISAPPAPQQQPPPGPQPMPITAPAPGPPPAPASTPSYLPPAPSSHMTPISTSHGMSPMTHLSPSEPGPSPHSSIATPPNYGLYSGHGGSYYGDVPVVGFSSLSSWAAYGAGPAQGPFVNHSNGSSSSLSNFDGSKDQQHSHTIGHHHHHPQNGIMVTYDHAHP